MIPWIITCFCQKRNEISLCAVCNKGYEIGVFSGEIILQNAKPLFNIPFLQFRLLYCSNWHASLFNFDEFVKSPTTVIPANAGIQKYLNLLDSAKASLRARLSPE